MESEVFPLVFFNKAILARSSDLKAPNSIFFPDFLASQTRESEVESSHTKGSSMDSETLMFKLSSFAGVTSSTEVLKQWRRGAATSV